MRALLPVALGALLASGCRVWQEPPAEEAARVSVSHPGIRGPVRIRVRLDVQTPWLTGQFEGAVLAKPGPAVRAQFFPDLGGKVMDLLATPKRIVGYFPHLQEGLDCRLPEEARAHPLVFMGLHFLERVAPLDESRITGWRALKTESPGQVVRAEARAESLVEGVSLEVGLEKSGLLLPPYRITERRFRWMYGVSWTERPDKPDSFVVEAPRVRIRVDILEVTELKEVPPGAFELTLPPDVRRTDR